MLPPLQIKSTEGWISLLPCRTVEARAAVAIFITGLCHTEDLLQEESISKKMNSQYVRFEVFGCETEELTDFWEKTIEKQTKHLQIEKERQQRSALPKLRTEWKERLEKRIQMMKTQNEEPAS
ncbi:protein FAM240B [Chelonia mydas]|uniref:protein FAM240B n=1 Tax=Chelonia mydas TaxID=8469 RepID=UPI001CA94E99|nr:protein FAM240B [Chelonia mydas]